MTKCCICGKEFSFFNACIYNSQRYCSECYKKEVPKLKKKEEQEEKIRLVKQMEIDKKEEAKIKEEYKKREIENLNKGFWYWIGHSSWSWLFLIIMIWFSGIIGFLAGLFIEYTIYYLSNKQAILYECEYCRKQIYSQEGCRKHEQECNKNRRIII